MNDQRAVERRIAALLAAYAEGAPIDVDPMAMTRLAAAGAGHQRRPWLGLVPSGRGLGLVLLALVLLTAIVAGALLAGARPFRPTIEHAAGFGVVRLPPEGVPASSPESGSLLVFYWGPPASGGKGWYWVYADGRLISQPDANVVHGPIDPWTGFFEQRLTPEAAELLRAEAVRRTGLDGRPFFGVDPFPERIPWYSAMRVYDGDRLVDVEWARELSRLITQIKDPGTWLPSSAWVQQQPIAYVASRYAVCYGVRVPGDRGLPMEPTEILALLPSSAEEALRGGAITPSVDFAESYCSNVTTADARAAAASLRQAGFASGDDHPLLFSTEVSATQTGRTLFVSFAPVLPHGEWKCLECG